MNGFCDFLRELPSEGARLRIKCLYYPSDNEASSLPGRVINGSLTFQMNTLECMQFSDWLENNGLNHISPMKILWKRGESKIEYNIDEETLKVYTDSNQILRASYQFSEREHLDLDIRSHPRVGAAQENWRGNRNIVQ